jgi:hypothetical protein
MEPLGCGLFGDSNDVSPGIGTRWRHEFEPSEDLANGQQVITKRQADGTAGLNPSCSASQSSVFGVLLLPAGKTRIWPEFGTRGPPENCARLV